MPKFLFWNLGGKPVTRLLREVAAQENVDVLILAECPLTAAAILLGLNETAPNYQFARGECERLQFFTRFDSTFVKPLYESARVSIRRLVLPGRENLILAAAHLPSKLHFSEGSQAFECVNLADAIAEVEKREGHRRTILVGDFNANPFEEGVVSARGLHAVMTRAVALKDFRTVQQTMYPFFYNPMWGHFGDRPDGPPGTFYYEKAEHVAYFWNMFDQFLIRPELARSFQYEDVRILTKIGSVSLLRTDGRPDATTYSDHLPITLQEDF